MSAAASSEVKSFAIEPAAIRTRSPNFGARRPSVFRYWNLTKLLISSCSTPTPPSFVVTDEETIFTFAKIPAASTAMTSTAPPTSPRRPRTRRARRCATLFEAMIPPTAMPLAP